MHSRYNRLGMGCCISLFSLISISANAAPIISELYYDAPNSDAGQVFIELWGTPGSSLEGMELVGINGGNGSPYKTMSLSGVFPSDGVFVIADPPVDGVPPVAEADLLLSVDLQNGPDSLLLTSGDQVLDALAYGDFSNAFPFGEGAPAQDVGPGQSLARWNPLLDTNDNAFDFTSLDAPTPGSVPLGAVTVPIPAAAGLYGAGLMLLGTRMRRRKPFKR